MRKACSCWETLQRYRVLPIPTTMLSQQKDGAFLMLATLGLTAGAYSTFFQKKASNPKAEDGGELTNDPDCIYRGLNHVECQYQAISMDPIFTMTWYEGNDEAMQDAIHILENRIRETIRANPWLAGDLVRSEDRQHVFIKYPQKVDLDSAAKKLFFLEIDKPSKYHHEMKVLELRHVGRENGYALAGFNDFNQPLFKLAIMKSSKDPSIFGIAISMSHFVGDGHTYYAIYNMLVAGEKIEALDDARILDDEEQQAKVFTKNERGMFNNPGFLLNAFSGTLMTQLGSSIFGWTSTKKYARCILVDRKKIEEMKRVERERIQTEGERDGISFVSTNDILTHWFFKGTGSRHCVMLANLRGRLPNHRINLAGNYQGTLYFRYPEDARKPALIRQALPKLKRVHTAEEDLAKWEMLSGNVSIITSWASFISKHVQLGSGCRQLIHLPCIDIGFRGGNKMSFCVIFQATPTHMGMMYYGSKEAHERLRDAPFEAKEEFPLWGSKLEEVPVLGIGHIYKTVTMLDYKYLGHANKAVRMRTKMKK